jgi:Ankyrin repeats (3 copies)
VNTTILGWVSLRLIANAVIHHYSREYVFLLSLRQIRLLKSEQTPLSRAAERGNKRIVELLLQNGARPDFEDENGQTPLSRASASGNGAVVELLNSY